MTMDIDSQLFSLFTLTYLYEETFGASVVISILFQG